MHQVGEQTSNNLLFLRNKQSFYEELQHILKFLDLANELLINAWIDFRNAHIGLDLTPHHLSAFAVVFEKGP